MGWGGRWISARLTVARCSCLAAACRRVRARERERGSVRRGIAFERFLVTFDPAERGRGRRATGRLRGCCGAGAMRRFLEVAPTVGPGAVRASCEVAVALGTQLGLPVAVLDAFTDVFERWDGRGLSGALAGEAVHPIARIVAVAEQAAIAHATGGVAAAHVENGRRAGGHLDPSLCEAFLESAEELLAPIEAADDFVDALHAAEPAPVLSFAATDLADAGIAPLWSSRHSAPTPGKRTPRHHPPPPESPANPGIHTSLQRICTQSQMHRSGRRNPHSQVPPSVQIRCWAGLPH
jgi:hypothetical protein